MPAVLELHHGADIVKKTSSRSEALDAYCADCDWESNADTSRKIRKQANRHAARRSHLVRIRYETIVSVRFVSGPSAEEDKDD